MMNIEILCPAGSSQSLECAVMSGADAVYFGTQNFNARKNAKNFTEEDIETYVKYCRLRGVKTYVTLNTAVFDSELLQLKDTVVMLNRLGVDGVIVSDLGVLEIVKNVAPKLKISASTQMTVHNLDGVLKLKQLGFSRVVLSRELSFEDIKYICKHSPIEIEVFVHGALCMCYSGACLMSAHLGGRSGNRGLCAQPCRLDYTLGSKSGALLSLKDLCLLEYVEKLDEIGVTSIKIEGRMKRSEYVCMVAQAYSQAKKGVAFDYNKLAQLDRVFSRDGFTSGYFNNELGNNMFGSRSQRDKQDSEKNYANLYKSVVREGHEADRVKIKASVSGYIGNKMCLEITDEDNNYVRVLGQVCEKSSNRSLQKEDVIKAVSKTASVPFYFENQSDISVNTEDGIFMPISALNALRKDAFEKLCDKRRAFEQREEGDIQLDFLNASDKKEAKAPEIHARFYSKSSIPDSLEGVYFVWCNAQDIDSGLIEKCTHYNAKLGVVLSRIIYDNSIKEYEKTLNDLYKSGVKFAICSNIGAFELAKRIGFEITADFTMNIYNSLALDTVKNMGARACVSSVEMNYKQIKDIKKCVPFGIVVYGKLPLMVYKNCVIKNSLGHCSDKCDLTGEKLVDRKGYEFTLLKDKNVNSFGKNAVCGNMLLNSKTLVALENGAYKNIDADFIMLYFTTETKAQAAAAISAYKNCTALDIEDKTHGLYKTGVL